MLLVAIVVGYLVGSVPFAYLIARLRGHDLLVEGRGGVSAAAAMDRAGVGIGLVGGAADALKATAVVLALRWTASLGPGAVAGLAAVTGQIWPATLRLRGGRGVGAAVGTLLALDPMLAALPLAGMAITRVAWRDSAPGALAGFAAAAVAAAATHGAIAAAAAALVLLVLAGRLGGYRKHRASRALRSTLLWRALLDRDAR